MVQMVVLHVAAVRTAKWPHIHVDGVAVGQRAHGVRGRTAQFRAQFFRNSCDPDPDTHAYLDCVAIRQRASGARSRPGAVGLGGAGGRVGDGGAHVGQGGRRCHDPARGWVRGCEGVCMFGSGHMRVGGRPRARGYEAAATCEWAIGRGRMHVSCMWHACGMHVASMVRPFNHAVSWRGKGGGRPVFWHVCRTVGGAEQDVCGRGRRLERLSAPPDVCHVGGDAGGCE